MVGMGLFFIVVAFAQVLTISDAVTGLGISAGDILQALLYSLPPLMGILIPVSALFAVLLGVGRLASDREVIGLAALGITPYRLLRVPFLFGFLLTLIATVTMSIGEPWGVKGLRRLMTQSAQDALARGIRPGEFVEWVPGVTFYAEERDGELLKDVVFADRRDAKKPVVISARTGRVVSGKGSRDIIFALDDGAILLRDMTSGAQRVVHFEKSRYRLDVGKLVKKKAITLTSTQAKDIPTLIEQKSDPKYRKNWALLTITLHRKFSVPLATLIFALLAVPLATRSSGGARARGFLYSSGIVAAYYYVGRALELAARSGKIDAVLATWTPNIVGVIALVWLLIRFKRKWI